MPSTSPITYILTVYDCVVHNKILLERSSIESVNIIDRSKMKRNNRGINIQVNNTQIDQLPLSKASW